MVKCLKCMSIHVTIQCNLIQNVACCFNHLLYSISNTLFYLYEFIYPIYFQYSAFEPIDSLQRGIQTNSKTKSTKVFVGAIQRCVLEPKGVPMRRFIQ